MTSSSLPKGNNEQGGQGGGQAEQANPDGGVVAERIGTNLCLGGLDIDNVVLLQIVFGGKGDAGLGEVEMDDMTTADGVFAQELHVIAVGKEGHVASLSQRLEDVDALVGDGERTRVVDLAYDADLEIVDADGDIGLFVEVGLKLLADECLALAAGKAGHGEPAEHGIIDAAFVVDQVVEQLGISRTLCVLTHLLALPQLAEEGYGGGGVGRADDNDQLVLGHDAVFVKASALLDVVEHTVVAKVN